MYIVFHEDALKEMTEAAIFYEDQLLGLGQYFLDELDKAFNLVAEMPSIYPMIGKRTHKKVLYRFPYNIIYSIEKDRIRILAVAHQKRRPYYWHDRVIDCR